MDQINAKAYESMVARRSYNYKEIEEALEIVEKFIIDKKLVLYGGMALDLAAKLKGEFVYDPKDNVLPDMDFFSPEPIKHAYELAEILFKKGYAGVNAISAMHVSTLRIRISDDVVADISYMPPVIFDDMKTLKVGKLTIVHPLYQRMDQHKAWTGPMRTPPMEAIFNRFSKDMTRFQLIDRLYPIEDNPDLKNVKYPILAKVIIPNYSDVLWTGYISYAVHYYQLVKLMKSKFKISDEILKKFKEVYPLKLTSRGCDLYVEIPLIKSDQTDQLTFWTDELEKMVEMCQKTQSKKTEPKQYKPYMDSIRPHMARVGKFDVFDNKGDLKPMFVFNMGKAELSVTTGQSTLLYFLHLYFTTSSEKKCFYFKMYQSCKTIIEITESILIDNDVEYNEWIPKLSIFLSMTLYGSSNHSEVYHIAEQYIKYNIDDVSFDKREKLRPKSFYPERGQDKPTETDVSKFKYFQIDGLEIKK